MFKITALRLALLTVLTVVATGCQPFQHPESLRHTPPPDFALRVTIDAPWHGDANPAATASTYILEPDRRLHAALGPGAIASYFPPPTATVTHDEIAQLWSIIETGQLLSEPGLDAKATAKQQALVEAASPQDTTAAQTASDALAMSDSSTWVPDEDTPVLYDVEITAWGQHHAFFTTPQDSPGTVRLVLALAELRGWAPTIMPADTAEVTNDSDL